MRKAALDMRNSMDVLGGVRDIRTETSNLLESVEEGLEE
jgi:antitoxin (DNA-binding transcriptional repressor) of toxin-antitoxin stability system